MKSTFLVYDTLEKMLSGMSGKELNSLQTNNDIAKKGHFGTLDTIKNNITYLMTYYALRVGTETNEIMFLNRKDRMKRLFVLALFMGLPLCAIHPPVLVSFHQPENDPLFAAISQYEEERCGFHDHVVKRKSAQVCIEEVRSENARFWESPGLRHSMWFLVLNIIRIRQELDRATDPLERADLRYEREQVRNLFRKECVIRSIIYWLKYRP